MARSSKSGVSRGRVTRTTRGGSAREATARATRRDDSARSSAAPLLEQRGKEIQKFGEIVRLPIGLDAATCKRSVEMLNQVLADTMTLRDLYKKHHWQVAGHTFYSLHLLFDKHYEEQAELVDTIAERIQILGGLAVAMAPDVAEMTQIERPPRGREEVPVQISRILEAHEQIIRYCHKAAGEADEKGDDGTNDLLVSDVIRLNELQVWFVAEHLVPEPLVHAT